MPQLQHAKPTIRNNTVQNTARLKNHLKYFHSAFLWPENQLLLQNCKTYGLDILKPISYTLLTPYHSKIKIKISPQCINERHIHDMSFVFAL